MNSSLQEATSTKRRILSFALVVTLMALLVLPGFACSQPEQPKQEETPDLVGMTQDDAQRMIEGYGFTVGEVTKQESKDVDAGLVISQDKTKGEMMDLGTAISMVVSTGYTAPPVDVKVPNLAGMTQTQAEEALFNLKLVPIPQNPVPQAGVTPGQVFTQTVAPDTVVKEGTEVGFTVALGNSTLTVPQVSGLAKDAAVKALTDAGFGVDVHEDYNASVNAGVIIAQNPYAGIQVLSGTTVVLSVSKGALPVGQVKVPNFVTLNLAQANQTAANAGLVIAPIGPDLNGVAANQSIAPGTYVDPGTTVQIMFGPADSGNGGNVG